MMFTIQEPVRSIIRKDREVGRTSRGLEEVDASVLSTKGSYLVILVCPAFNLNLPTIIRSTYLIACHMLLTFGSCDPLQPLSTITFSA